VKAKILSCVYLAVAILPVFAASMSQPGVGPGAGTRYATDAYPGFDSEEEMVKPSRKEPRLFGWITGPKKDDSVSQFAYCEELMAEGSYSKAAKQLDALVRQWPTALEAPKAQLKLAELMFAQLQDFDEAFSEYRYLVDFYSLNCDYNVIVDKLYEIAGIMRKEGKTIMFFRFRNTVDVRRAFECCVLRAPGAKWAAAAMLTIAELREEEGKLTEAIKVYENLRNIHLGSPEAATALYRESKVRMAVLGEHEYNRSRCRDTIDFLKMAEANCEPEFKPEIKIWKDQAIRMLEDEAYAAAKFYDSKTRTARSAVNAYERFLAEHPASIHAEAVKARLEELKNVNGGGK
jgi:outer membrane protein assembly factor BamD (BamD/ComL family)